MVELSLNILDIIQNSVVAGATLIQVRIEEGNGLLAFTVEDNGCGMSPEFLQRAVDPFTTTRTTRKVGFGLPLVKQMCEMCDGSFAIESQEGIGTKLHASFGLEHIDRPPLGDIAGTMLAAILSNAQLDFLFIYAVDGQEAYELDTRDVKEVLEGMPLSDPAVIGWLRENLSEGIAALSPKG